MIEAPRQLAAVERALAATEAVAQVVDAVWALARAQLSAVEAAAGDASAYLDWVEQLAERFAGPASRAGPQETLWILTGPERPFCGALARRIAEQLPGRGPVGLVGTRLSEAVRLDRDRAARVCFALPGPATPEDLAGSAERVARAILDQAHAGRVAMLHPTRGTTALHRVTLLAGPRLPAGEGPETFSPRDEVLAAAVHEAVTGRIVVGLAEALRTEVRARLVASEGARHGCEQRLDMLRQSLRVLRQEQTTTELLEIVAARAAATSRD